MKTHCAHPRWEVRDLHGSNRAPVAPVVMEPRRYASRIASSVSQSRAATDQAICVIGQWCMLRGTVDSRGASVGAGATFFGFLVMAAIAPPIKNTQAKDTWQDRPKVFGKWF